MKKNTSIYNDEIDLITLLKILWDGKIKIILILLISILLGFGYDFQTANNYLTSLSVSKANSNTIRKIFNIKKLLKLDSQNNLDETSEIIFSKVIIELSDYEEFLLSLKNTKKIRESISKLNIEDQEKEIVKYAKLFQLVKNKENFILNFKWHDPDEAKKILKETLELTLENLNNLIILELLSALEFEERFKESKDKERLIFLTEQSLIAKELKIKENKIANLYSLNQENSYYLRGYTAIDKEIELIQKRKYENLLFAKKEINNLKNMENNFVKYNINLTKTKLLKNSKFTSIVSILIGLIIGVFYVIILNEFKTHNIKKNIKVKKK